MEQIPNNTSEERVLSDYDVLKKEFKYYFFKLCESNTSMTNQLQEFLQSKLGELSESDANVAINDEIKNFMNTFVQKKTNFIIDQLKEKLKYIIENYSTTVLDNIFDILIDLLIKKYKQKEQLFFISFEQIYEIFYLFGFRIILSETLDKLIGALQWDIISHYWLNYNFLKNYFKSISSKKDISTELKKKTWTLVELTRIKKQEFEKKYKKFRIGKDFYKLK